jgi:hypothetical protein
VVDRRRGAQSEASRLGLARTLEVEGQRAARAIPHDELLATGGELAVGMAHNDLISLDPELLK